MGEKLFDDLARALVEPVPRSRALRLIGSILVATSLPGAAFARSRRPANGCGGFYCSKTQFGGQYCCPGETCCGKGKLCCRRTERCGKDQGISYCEKCDRLERCGPKCCPKGIDCCWRPRDAEPERPYDQRNVCCKPPNLCDAGICTCPNGKETCVGSTCCKKNDICLVCHEVDAAGGAKTTGGRKCCPKGTLECCGSKCCEPGTTCCGTRCCPTSLPVCGRALRGTNIVCCTQEQYAIIDGKNVCCPPGTHGTVGACCPLGQDYC